MLHVFLLNFVWKETILSVLKGNNSSNTYKFRIKVGNVQMIYCTYFQSKRCKISSKDTKLY